MNLDPYYLLLYLNSYRVKKYIEEVLVGTRQQIVKIKSLEDLEIPILDIEVQRELGEMSKVGIEESRRLKEYLSVREELFNAKLEDKLKGEV